MSESTPTKTYRLYALPLTQENVEAAYGERFSRVTRGYVLLYTYNDAPVNGVEIGIEEVNRLTSADYSWLSDCNCLIVADAAKEKEAQIAGDMKRRIDALERALKAEKDKQKGKVEA